jgi:hypothetical protein
MIDLNQDQLSESIKGLHDALFPERPVQHAIQLGLLLQVAKEKLPHGQWATYLKEHCPRMNPKTAQRYMLLARHCYAMPKTKKERRKRDSLLEGAEL